MANSYIYKAQCPEEDLKTLIHEHGHAVVLVAAHGKSWDNYQSGVLEDCEYHKKCPEESSLPKTDPNYKVCKQVYFGLKLKDVAFLSLLNFAVSQNFVKYFVRYQ